MAYKVALISLGCAKNLVDSEQMLCLMNDAGIEIVPESDGADAVIVNTCGFIDSAKMEAIETILSLGEMKAAGGVKKIIVAGCLSERYKEQLLDEMPEIDAIVGVGSYTEIVEVVEKSLEGSEKTAVFGDIDAPYAEEGRIVSTGGAYAYIKIAEGCDNRCAYCVIPSLRGRYRSRPVESVVNEAEALAASGIKELIVIAQDITRYGTDIYGRRALGELLEKLCAIDGIKWIRLHYLYPDEIDDALIDVVARNGKILKYLDIPIQHINDRVLKLMNRRGTGAEIRALFRKLRERIPGVVLRTSLITGLPGEGEAEFEELCEFLREAKIERAGVFPYSAEEGTPAEKMERVGEDVASARAERVMELQDRVMEEYNASRIGTETELLCEGYDEERGLFFGRSFAESPDIDGRILFTGDGIAPERFYTVKITDEADGELIGRKIG